MTCEWRLKKGRPHRAQLYVNGELVKEVSLRIVSWREIVLLQSRPFPQCLEALAPLEEQGALRVAIERLAHQAYHSTALKGLLARHCVSEEIAARVIAYCASKGYLNDNEWVSQRLRGLRARGKSTQAIKADLWRRGVEACVPEADIDALRVVVGKKYPQFLQKDLPPQERARILRALCRRGFSFSVIQKFLCDKALSSCIASDE